jgi:pimeloyl-ACP methyl ester carboxylesterase
MGGKIAQILAGRRPDGLRAAVLVAPAPPTPLLVPDERKRYMLDSYATPIKVMFFDLCLFAVWRVECAGRR